MCARLARDLASSPACAKNGGACAGYQATRDQAAKVDWRTQKWPESHSNTGKESELSRALTHDVLFGLVH